MGNKQAFDSERAEHFAGELVSTLNRAALSFMLSIGHRSGLFDTLADMDAAESAEIAAKAGLQERYVREWLGAMVTGGIVDYEPANGTYMLPAEHAAFLTRQAGSDNLAVFMQYAAVMGAVEDEVLRCFREGGGVPYSSFHRFHEVMAEDSALSVASALETHILPLVPGLTERLQNGIDVLDAGCGSGRILHKLAGLFPDSRFTGCDLSQEAIERGDAEATAAGLHNLRFEVRDLSDFHETAPADAFDFITTFDAIHDQARPLNVLRGIHRALRSDGVYLMQDISGTSHLDQDKEHPIGPFLYSISCMHCMTVSLAQGGEGLGAMWGEEKTHEYLRKAGFSQITTHKLAHDIQNNWYVSGK